MSRARRLLATLLPALAIPLLVAAPARSAASDAPYNNAKILEFMNAERQARGVRAVSRDPALDRKAQEWANKLAAEGRMYHSACCAGMAVGYRSAAQNLAYHDDALSAAQAHNMWMASGVHRKNMLDPAFSHVGIAMACSAASGRPYVMAVVEFGGDSAPSQGTPSRSPQVAGGSGSQRAMSCDGGSAAADPAPDPPAAKSSGSTAPSTTVSKAPAQAASSTPTTAPAVKAAKASPTTLAATTSTPAKKTSTTTTTKLSAPSTERSAEPSPASIASVSTTLAQASPSPAPVSIPADLAATRSESRSSAIWPFALSVIAGMILAAQVGRNRRSAYVPPKHSARRSRRRRQ